MTEIRTTCQVGKRLSIKRVKQDDEEIVVAELAFTDAALKRDEADEVLGVPIGWSAFMFDELGAPAFRGSIALAGKPLDVTAVIGLTKGHKLRVAGGATLAKIALELEPNGFLLSGTFTWAIAGDESEEAEDLIGKLCTLTLTVERKQRDLLAAA